MSRHRIAAPVLGLLLVLSATSGVGSALLAGADDAPATTDPAGTVLDAGSLAAGPGQVVAGETNLSAGARVHVRIVTTPGESPQFIATRGAVVAPDGTFRSTFDLERVAAGTSVNVSVVRDGSTLASTTTDVGDCTAACAATRPETPAVTLAPDRANLSLAAGPGRVVAGETDLPPGTDLTVRLAQTGADAEFESNRSAVVGEDGRFRASFDLSDAESESSVAVRVLTNGSALAAATGTVVPCETDCEAPPSSTGGDEREDRNESQVDDLSVVETTQGDVARFELTFESETATVRIGGPAVSYELLAAVTDGNDDDRVTLRFVTDEVGNGSEVVSAAAAADSVTVLDERVDGDRDVIDEGQYPVRQSVGPTPTSRDDDPETFLVERGTFVVRDAPMDERGDEPVVVDAGLPKAYDEDGDYAGVKPVRVRMNETVRFPVLTDESKAVTVVVGPFSPSFTRSAVVRDGNGDERVDLVFDTTAASSEDDSPALTTANSSDTVTVTYENGSVSPGTYRVFLYRRTAENVTPGWQNATSEAGSVFGTGRLVVSEGNSTPTLESDAASESGSPLPSLGALAVAGALASVGVAFLSGIFGL